MSCDRFNVDSLFYMPPSSNKAGGKQVMISTVEGSTSYKDRIRFQMCEDDHTNLQTIQWGLQSQQDAQNSVRRNLEVTVESESVKNFLSMLDQKNLQTATQNMSTWFKSVRDEGALKDMYTPLLRATNDGKVAVRVKVNCGEEYPTDIYVATSPIGSPLVYKKGNSDHLVRGSKCMVMVDATCLYFINNRAFGMTLNAKKMVVWPSLLYQQTGINAFNLASKPTLETDVEMDDEPM